MKYRNAECTLDSVIRQLELSTASDNNVASTIDTLIATKYANSQYRLKELIFDQSEQLYNVVNRVGIPYQHTASWKGNAYRRDLQCDPRTDDHMLRLPDDLLSITSYTWSGTALDSDAYYLYPVDKYPAREVGIYSDQTFTRPSSSSESVALVGIWGYHRNPSTMWLNSTDSVQNVGGINSSVTSITVTDADGNNANNGMKRFETLQYIKVDDEFMLITGINTSTNVLTVKRGANGTTAAAHDNAATIYTYEHDDVFETAVRRRVVYLYQNPSESRRIVPLPDGTLQLDDEDRIPLPPKRYYMGSA